MKKTIILLANSRKHMGRCLAGREYLVEGPGNWLRPVSNRVGEEVDWEERSYADKTEPSALDIIEVPLIQHKPHACHIENWLLSPREKWVKTGSLSWEQASIFSQNPAELWINGSHTYHGLNDEISETQSARLQSSICMIRVSSAKVEVRSNYKGYKQVFVNFKHNDINYRISMTDSVAEAHFKTHPIGYAEDFGQCLLTISISEPFPLKSNTRYKLVAAFMPKSTA